MWCEPEPAWAQPGWPAIDAAPSRGQGVDHRMHQDSGQWRILVVDNDPDVHASTLAALQGHTLFGRPLALMHAFCDDEATAMLLREHDFAMVMLDVVSGRASPGLELVDFIRHTAGLRNTRIVLRTGQSGQVPDLQTLLRYDINDYCTKAELTRDRLLAMVVTAVRSYKQLCAVDASRVSLELIVRSNAALLETRNAHEFATAVLTQVCTLLKVEPEGIVCAQRGEGCNDYCVLAASGRFAELVGLSLDLLAQGPQTELLMACAQQRSNVYAAHGGLALHIGHQDEQDLIVFVDVPRNHPRLDPQLLDVLCANLATLLHNRGLLGRLR